MSGRRILAVDQSTSATKALIFDESARPINRVTVEHHQYYPQSGWVEHDPEEILRNTVDALVKVVRDSGTPLEDIVALAITNQRETIVAWDEADGKPVYNALVWQDERGSSYCDVLKSSGAASMVRDKTGLVVDPYFSASKIQWILENSQAAHTSLRAGRLMCGTIDSWLIWNLTGRKVFATDYSNACRTLLFDINQLRWDEDLLRIFGLSGILLPRPLPSDGDFGVATVAPLSLTVPIRGVMGDSHAALFGHAAFEQGSAKATYGTGSSIMMNIGAALRTPPEGIVSSIGWGMGNEVTYVFEGNINHSGDTVRWVRENLGLFKSFAEAEELSASIESNGGVYLVPAFTGLGAPRWVHGIRALITGLSRGSGKAEIVRAAYESIAYQVRDVIQAMAVGGHLELSDLHVDGGPTENRFLMQFQADILGAPLRVASIEEVSARGVVFMAGLRKGLWDGIGALSRLAVPAATYEAAMPAETREALVRGWNGAVAQALFKESM